MDSPVADRATVDFLSYHYLLPCVERAGKKSRGVLLDIGCGNKPYQSFFSNVTKYVGCDVIQSSRQVVDVLCQADAIPLSDCYADTIVCTQTIEHVANFPGLLSEAYRLLKPGGTFYLSGPMYWYHHEEPYDFFRFTSHGFRYALEKAGFVVETIEPNGGKWAMVGLVLLHAFPVRLRYYPRIIKLVNSFFLYLDRKRYDPINTSNFFVTSTRPL